MSLAPVLLATLLWGAPPAACATTDLMPRFWEYWERAKGHDPAEQYRLFEEMVQKPNAAVYEGAFHGAPRPPSEFVPKTLAQVPELETRMRELSGKLAADLPSELDAFRKAFPKFRCTVPVTSSSPAAPSTARPARSRERRRSSSASTSSRG